MNDPNNEITEREYLMNTINSDYEDLEYSGEMSEEQLEDWLEDAQENWAYEYLGTGTIAKIKDDILRMVDACWKNFIKQEKQIL